MYLNLDENGYLLSICDTGSGVEADIDLANYDLSGYRINAYRWVDDEFVFDDNKYSEIMAEIEPTEEIKTPEQRIAELEAALELLLSGATE